MALGSKLQEVESSLTIFYNYIVFIASFHDRKRRFIKFAKIINNYNVSKKIIIPKGVGPPIDMLPRIVKN